MIVVGLTGGIASGKTTIINFLKKKKFATHESDSVVKSVYSRPTLKFINYLKKISFKNILNGRKINKDLIREEIFNNLKKKKLLEEYIHKEVKKSRDQFLKKQIKTKIVFLDIPLLFENNLDKICDYTILLYTPQKKRKQRAMRRKGMNKKILEKIIKSQLGDAVKRKKADFVIQTSNNRTHSYNQVIWAIETIINKKNERNCS